MPFKLFFLFAVLVGLDFITITACKKNSFISIYLHLQLFFSSISLQFFLTSRLVTILGSRMLDFCMLSINKLLIYRKIFKVWNSVMDIFFITKTHRLHEVSTLLIVIYLLYFFQCKIKTLYLLKIMDDKVYA